MKRDYKTIKVPTYADIKASKDATNPEMDVYLKTLCREIQSGSKEAAEALIKACQGFVHSIIRKDIKNYGPRAEYDDLMQAGYLGLLNAAQKMDVTLDTSFFTYATYWVHQSSVREAHKGYVVHIPEHEINRIYNIIKIDGMYQHVPQNERKNLILESLGISEEQFNWSIKTITRFVYLRSTDKIVDAYDAEADTPLLGFLTANNLFYPGRNEEPLVEDIVFHKELRKMLYFVMDYRLTPRERDIIIRRFGIESGVEESLEAIGKDYKVGRERIRQIEAKALRKLRYSIGSQKCLKDFLT